MREHLESSVHSDSTHRNCRAPYMCVMSHGTHAKYRKLYLMHTQLDKLDPILH